MTHTTITCPLCGTTYDPEAHPGCSTCPLHSNCSMVCCPNCGHTTVNPAKSRLAKSLEALFPRTTRDTTGKKGDSSMTFIPIIQVARDKLFNPRKDKTNTHSELQLMEKPGCLADVPEGTTVEVLDIGQQLSHQQRAQLTAYGLIPGCRVRVLQQHPVTVIQIDFTELALECELAAAIQISIQ